MVSHALGVSRLDIYLQFDKPCTEEELARLRELTTRRLKREPLAYVFGEADFMSLSLRVGPGVLIPRPETEILVQTAWDLIDSESTSDEVSILELGTGSGAIAIALAAERSNLGIVSVDKNRSALNFAQANLRRYQSQIESNNSQLLLVCSDRFSGIKQRAEFDLMISNPPYIPSSEIDGLQPEVSRWEPRDALDGGLNGLDFMSYLFAEAELRVKPGGFLIVEHGFDQRDECVAMAKRVKLKVFKEIKDYSGHDRVLVFQRG